MSGRGYTQPLPGKHFPTDGAFFLGCLRQFDQAYAGVYDREESEPVEELNQVVSSGLGFYEYWGC